MKAHSEPLHSAELKSALQSIEAKNYDGAISQLKKYVLNHPNNGAAMGMLAYSYDMKGQYKKARKLALKALKFSPKSDDIHFLLGHSYARDNDLTSALKHLTLAYKINPNKRDIRLELVKTLLQRVDISSRANKWLEASLDLDIAHGLDPKNMDISVALALAYAKLKKWSQAIPLVSQVKFAQITNRKEYFRQLSIFYDARINDAKLNADLTPTDPQKINELAESYYARGILRNKNLVPNFDASEQDFLKVLELQPANVNALRALGRLHDLNENWDQAIQYYSQCLTFKSSMDVLSSRGLLYIKIKKYYLAIQDLAIVYQNQPENIIYKNELAHAYFKYGQELQQNKKFAVAMENYNKALTYNSPLQGDIYYERALCLSSLGKTHLAIDALDKAIKANTQDFRAYIERAQLRRKIRDYQGAVEDYTMTIMDNPNLAQLYLFRGEVFTHLQDWDRAQIDFDKYQTLDPVQAASDTIITNLKRQGHIDPSARANPQLKNALFSSDVNPYLDLPNVMLLAGLIAFMVMIVNRFYYRKRIVKKRIVVSAGNISASIDMHSRKELSNLDSEESSLKAQVECNLTSIKVFRLFLDDETTYINKIEEHEKILKQKFELLIDKTAQNFRLLAELNLLLVDDQPKQKKYDKVKQSNITREQVALLEYQKVKSIKDELLSLRDTILASFDEDYNRILECLNSNDLTTANNLLEQLSEKKLTIDSLFQKFDHIVMMLAGSTQSVSEIIIKNEVELRKLKEPKKQKGHQLTASVREDLLEKSLVLELEFNRVMRQYILDQAIARTKMRERKAAKIALQASSASLAKPLATKITLASPVSFWQQPRPAATLESMTKLSTRIGMVEAVRALKNTLEAIDTNHIDHSKVILFRNALLQGCAYLMENAKHGHDSIFPVKLAYAFRNGIYHKHHLLDDNSSSSSSKSLAQLQIELLGKVQDIAIKLVNYVQAGLSKPLHHFMQSELFESFINDQVIEDDKAFCITQIAIGERELTQTRDLLDVDAHVVREAASFATARIGTFASVLMRIDPPQARKIKQKYSEQIAAGNSIRHADSLTTDIVARNVLSA